jgi:glycosyltransferase involved in cell wall biosynthesis
MLTLFIPAYNEEALIRRNVLRVADELDTIATALSIEIHLVVVDDGSTDGTKEQVLTAIEERPRITYRWAPGPSRRENLVRAMLEADTPFVGWMDADLATSLDHLEELISLSPRYDIVTGSRYLASSRADRTVRRALISKTYNGLIRGLFRSRIRDHWCGFKIFRRSALETISGYIDVGVPNRQMFWDAQMWVCAQRLGLRILELPIGWKEGAKSALAIHTELPMMRYTMRYWASGRWRRIGASRAALIRGGAPTGLVTARTHR